MSVISRGQHFTSLPQEYYTSEVRFVDDMAKVWHRQWVYAGHVSQIRRPGDYYTFGLVGESVIIVRGRDNAVRAFFNVCRHRGTRICEGAGHARRLVCSYHSWSYDLDGRLAGVAGGLQKDDIDAENLGLIEAQVSVWQGLIFVNFGSERLPEVPPMIDKQTERDMSRLEPERMKIAHEAVYEVQANWKLLLENGVECYHCTGVHPEFCQTLDAKAMADYYRLDYNPALVQGIVIPVQQGKATLSLDGRLVSKKLLGEFGRGVPLGDYGGSGFMTQPGYCWGDFHPDHAMIANCLPIGPTHSKFAVQWLVHEDAEEGVDYEVDDVIGLWDVTHRQDADSLTKQQQGINSRHYVPGPNSAHDEPGIKSALQVYLEMVGEA